MRRIKVAVAVAGIIVLSACAAPLDSPAGQPTGTSSADTEPIKPGDLSPEDLDRLKDVECADAGDPNLRVKEVDVSQFTWSMPSGFRESHSYIQEDPVEGEYTKAVFLVPTNQQDSLDVIGIVLYPQLALGPLVSACNELDDSAAQARLTEYHDILGSTVIEGPTLTHVGELPTYEEVLDVTPRGYQWRSYWIFGDNQLFHLSCQWRVDKSTIEDGCAELVASVRFE